ncbi:uncharacterized protein LOC142344006 isoform X2 [Convolutriloba macropyga]|uniref:uncharacterized protein LOC142344006 isoform X2 n=1 Tax=Convolutriloba macropyga TaxID=536237 RepID=UPI003F51D99C
MRRSHTCLFSEIRHVECKQRTLIGRQLSSPLDCATTEVTRLHEVLHAAELAYEEATLHLAKSGRVASGTQKFPKIGSVLLDNLSEDGRQVAPQIGCSVCGSKLTQRALRCLFCNYRVCAKCFNEDLIVYVPSDLELQEADFWPNQLRKMTEEQKYFTPRLLREGRGGQTVELKPVRWAVSSATEWDPVFYEYFPLCTLCKIKLVSVKKEEHNDFQRRHFSKECEQFYISLAKAKLSVTHCMDELRRVFQNQSASNGSILKLQEEIEQKMSTFKKQLSATNELTPEKGSQITLVKNLTKGNQDWYRTAKSDLDNLLQDIYNTIPLKSLTEMQTVVEKIAICSAISVVKQIFEETMKICKQYELSFAILNDISSVESRLWYNLNHLDGLELEEFMYLKENLESHVSSMISQDKTIKFVVSTLQYEKEGKSYVLRVVFETTSVNLSRVMKDLTAKCRKRFIEETLDAISNLMTSHHIQMFSKPSKNLQVTASTSCLSLNRRNKEKLSTI